MFDSLNLCGQDWLSVNFYRNLCSKAPTSISVTKYFPKGKWRNERYMCPLVSSFAFKYSDYSTLSFPFHHVSSKEYPFHSERFTTSHSPPLAQVYLCMQHAFMNCIPFISILTFFFLLVFFFFLMKRSNQTLQAYLLTFDLLCSWMQIPIAWKDIKD